MKGKLQDKTAFNNSTKREREIGEESTTKCDSASSMKRKNWCFFWSFVTCSLTV